MLVAADKIARLAQLLKVFDLNDSLLEILLAPTRQDAENALRQVKAQVKTLYRRLAFQAHPDHGGDTFSFQALVSVYSELAAFSLSSPPILCPTCHGAGRIDPDHFGAFHVADEQQPAEDRAGLP